MNLIDAAGEGAESMTAIEQEDIPAGFECFSRYKKAALLGYDAERPIGPRMIAGALGESECDFDNNDERVTAVARATKCSEELVRAVATALGGLDHACASWCPLREPITFVERSGAGLSV